MKEFDAIIIGFGKGGKTLATELAQHDWKVAMIERSDKMYGGTCINIGCIPTKALIHQAELATLKKGLSFEERKADYRKAIAFKNNVTDKLRQKNYDNLAGNPNITVYTGEGQFVSPEIVRVTTKEETFELTAKHIFINTGAETVIPPISGIQDNPKVFTSTTIMELEELPRQLIIVGGGYIGICLHVRLLRSGSHRVGRILGIDSPGRSGYCSQRAGSTGEKRDSLHLEC